MTNWYGTHEKLLWHYGPERTAAILNGQDEATNADLEAWRNLGGRRSYSLNERIELGLKLIDQGATLEEAVLIAEVTTNAMRSALTNYWRRPK